MNIYKTILLNHYHNPQNYRLLKETVCHSCHDWNKGGLFENIGNESFIISTFNSSTHEINYLTTY